LKLPQLAISRKVRMYSIFTSGSQKVGYQVFRLNQSKNLALQITFYH